MITYRIPSSWMLSELTPLIKGKGSMLECSNYIGIKLTSDTLKLLKRILVQRPVERILDQRPGADPAFDLGGGCHYDLSYTA